MKRANAREGQSHARPWRRAAVCSGAQLGWLILTSAGQTVTLRVEEFLDSLGASPGLSARALDAWVLLPIVAMGVAYLSTLSTLSTDAITRGRTPSPRRGWGPGAAVTIATLLCSVFFLANRPYLLHRFSTVRENVLYRSAQMGEATLRRVIDRYGIRTLVVLRNSEEIRERESRLANSEGIQFIHVPMDETGHGVERFLEVVADPSNHPVLAHCRHGIARTGVVSAIYRMEYDGWDNADALAEARRIGGYDTLREGSAKREFILSYQALRD